MLPLCSPSSSRGFERSIAEIFAVPQIPRQEGGYYVCNIESMPSDMRPYFPPTSPHSP